MGDWTNTGVIRAGVFRNGQWWLDLNNDGVWDAVHDTVFDFGQAGDIPVIGDWDGTGVQRIGIFRNGQWWLDMNNDHVWDALHDTVFYYGQSGDVPVVGDWDNTGSQRIGIFRSGQWWLDMNGDHVWDVVHDTVFYYGKAGDAPVVGDRTHRLEKAIFAESTAPSPMSRSGLGFLIQTVLATKSPRPTQKAVFIPRIGPPARSSSMTFSACQPKIFMAIQQIQPISLSP